MASAHHLRHTYRTVLAELRATPDQVRLLLGHSLSGDVWRGSMTPHRVVESLRPLAERARAFRNCLSEIERLVEERSWLSLGVEQCSRRDELNGEIGAFYAAWRALVAEARKAVGLLAGVLSADGVGKPRARLSEKVVGPGAEAAGGGAVTPWAAGEGLRVRGLWGRIVAAAGQLDLAGPQGGPGLGGRRSGVGPYARRRGSGTKRTPVPA